MTIGVAAAGTGGVSYQWRNFGQPIAGATSANLTLRNLAPSNGGMYDVVVSDGSSTTVSQSSQLEVRGATSPAVLRPKAGFAARVEINGTVDRILPLSDGRFYAVGNFTTVGGTSDTGVVRFQSNGTVDSSFSPPVLAGTVTAAALQPDGKLIIGGSFTAANGQAAHTIARLNSDGTLDTTFNAGAGFSGHALTTLISAITIQPDGKIIVGGGFTSYNGAVCQLIARLNSDGSIDSAFSRGGGFGTDFLDQVCAVTIQANGQILVGGAFTSYAGVNCGNPVRLNADGTLDTGFNATNQAGVDGDAVDVIAVESDGRILVGGIFFSVAGQSQAGLYRLSAAGALDSTFSVPSLKWGYSSIAWVKSLVIQSDGRVLVGGAFSTYGTVTRPGLLRINIDGSVDPLFGSTGEFDGAVETIAVESDGHILAGGSFDAFNGAPRGGVARLDLNGNLTSSVFAAVHSPGTVTRVVPASNGKWVVVGEFTLVDGTACNNIARLNGDGSLDSSFVTGTGLNGGGYSNGPLVVCAQPDGKVIVAGEFWQYNGVSQRSIIRLNSDGTIDPAFSIGNRFLQSYAEANFTTLVLQADGKILVGGTITDANRVATANLIRLNSDGSLDSSFSSGVNFAFGPSVLKALSDGKILVAGYLEYFTSAAKLFRLNPDGTVDSSFKTDSLFPVCYPKSAVVQPDGKYVVAVESTQANLIRLNADGTTDLSYKESLGLKNADPTFPYAIYDIALQPDAKCVVGGRFTTLGGVPQPELVRFATDGSVDTSFTVPSLIPDLWAHVSDLEFTDDGGLLLAGDRFDFSDRVCSGLVALEPAPLPEIVSNPVAQSGPEGGTVNLSVSATGEALQYQWFKNGAAIVGATNTTLALENLSPSDAGSYTVMVSSGSQSVTSTPVYVTVVYSRISNGSVRGLAGTGDQTLTLGLAISGGGSKQVLLRGIGPSLAVLGVSGSLADSRMQVFNAARTVIAANDNWGGSSTLSALFNRLGAFPLATNSKDAAVIVPLGSGSYTAQVTGASGSGIAMVEAYDADLTTYSSRLSNLSVRAEVGTGDNIIVVGFVIVGTAPKRLLVRAVGPTLAELGVGGLLNDPQLEVFNAAGQPLQGNNDWGGDPALQNIFNEVGAFGLPTDSHDAAMVVTLQPGVYTVHVSGVGDSTGVALTEIYEVP